MSVVLLYTVSQKTIQLIFDHNFGKCKSIFKILSLIDSQGTVLLHYIAKFKNLK